MVVRLDHRGRAPQARRGRDRPARLRAPAVGSDPAHPRTARVPRALPAVRVDRHRRGVALQRHRVQGAAPVRRLPRTVRARQGDLS